MDFYRTARHRQTRSSLPPCTNTQLEAKLATLRVERERVAGSGGQPPESSR